jgi:hypothetical protein
VRVIYIVLLMVAVPAVLLLAMWLLNAWPSW